MNIMAVAIGYVNVLLDCIVVDNVSRRQVSVTIILLLRRVGFLSYLLPLLR